MPVVEPELEEDVTGEGGADGGDPLEVTQEDLGDLGVE